MRVIHDVRDVPIYHREPSDGMRPPIAPVLAQRDDCQLTVHLCHCQSPRHCLTFIVSEVWRFVERIRQSDLRRGVEHPH